MKRTTLPIIPQMVADAVTERVVNELERRGFGPTVARWIAHSIRQHGLQHTVETLGITLYDVQMTAEADQHNHGVMDLAWSTIGVQAKNKHLPH